MMDARSARSGTPITSRQQETSKGAKPKAKCPASPTRISRMQEKKELQTLNDRLASYIERNRHLEIENGRLNIEVNSAQETRSSEITNIKSVMNSEINKLRKCLDDEAKGRARIELENNRLKELKKELRSKLEKVNKDLGKTEADVSRYRNRYADLSTAYSQVEADQKKLAGQLKELNAQLAQATRQLEMTIRHLDEQILSRIGLENQLQTAQEALTLEKQMHCRTLSESKVTTVTTELDSAKAQHLDAYYKRILQEVREKYEEDFKRHKDGLQKLYGDKIHGLETDIKQKQTLANNYFGDLKKLKGDVEKVRKASIHLGLRNMKLKSRIVELEKTLQNERQEHSKIISILRKEMTDHMADYKELMDTKIALDVEISAYREMLEAEEHRLKYKPSEEGQGGSSTPSSSKKRKRTYTISVPSVKVVSKVHSDSRGDVVIEECEAEGKFVRIRNKIDEEILIGGWKLIKKSDDLIVTFKFPRTIKLRVGAAITIWSCDYKDKYDPPDHLVMNKQKWSSGDEMETILFNDDDEEEAIYLQKTDETRVSTPTEEKRAHDADGWRESDDGDGYHQGDDDDDGDDGDGRQEGNCRLM